MSAYLRETSANIQSVQMEGESHVKYFFMFSLQQISNKFGLAST